MFCVTRGAETYWPTTYPCQRVSGAAAAYDTVCHVFTQKPTLGALWSATRYAMQAPLAGPNKLNSWSDIFLSQCRHNKYACWLLASMSVSQGFSWRAQDGRMCHKNPNSHRASQDALKADSIVSCTHKHPCSARHRCVHIAWAPCCCPCCYCLMLPTLPKDAHAHS